MNAKKIAIIVGIILALIDGKADNYTQGQDDSDDNGNLLCVHSITFRHTTVPAHLIYAGRTVKVPWPGKCTSMKTLFVVVADNRSDYSAISEIPFQVNCLGPWR